MTQFVGLGRKTYSYVKGDGSVNKKLRMKITMKMKTTKSVYKIMKLY